MGFSFNNLKQKARTLISNAPAYLQKARTFATGVISGANKAHKLVSGVNSAIQDTPQLFNDKIRQGSHKLHGHVTKGVNSLNEKHMAGESFLQRVNTNLGIS